MAKTQEYVEQWLKRDLSQLSLAVIMIDGIAIDDDVVLVALGIDEGGSKHPLGVWQGATENTVAVQSLLTDLVSRGIDPMKRYLFVIDGAKALRKAIFTVFGKNALVQRCQEHKRRRASSRTAEEVRELGHATGLPHEVEGTRQATTSSIGQSPQVRLPRCSRVTSRRVCN